MSLNDIITYASVFIVVCVAFYAMFRINKPKYEPHKK